MPDTHSLSNDKFGFIGDSMKAWGMTKSKRCNLTQCIGGMLFLSALIVQPLWADDTLTVKRENDKTVYTIGAGDEKNTALGAQRDREKNTYSIGSSKQKKDEEALKQERSWDMLMNMGILVDQGKGRPGHSDSPGKPSHQGQPIKSVPCQ